MLVKLDHFPKFRGENSKNIWNHQLDNLKQIQVDERWGLPPTKQCEQRETKPWHAHPMSHTGWFIGILILAYDNPFITG